MVQHYTTFLAYRNYTLMWDDVVELLSKLGSVVIATKNDISEGMVWCIKVCYSLVQWNMVWTQSIVRECIRVRCNTTAMAGTINTDGLGCTTIQQQFVQHALGCMGMHHELVCHQYVPTVSKIHKHCSSNCIIGGSSSNSYRMIQIRYPGAL